MDDSDGRLDAREERIARNETLFREVNERVREVSDADASERIEFLCECGDAGCTESISLTRAEYERLRSDPLLFGVKPGHAIADVEGVVDPDTVHATPSALMNVPSVTRFGPPPGARPPHWTTTVTRLYACSVAGR